MKLSSNLFILCLMLSFNSKSQNNIFDLIKVREYSIGEVHAFCTENQFIYKENYNGGAKWERRQSEAPFYSTVYFKPGKVADSNYFVYTTNDYKFYKIFLDNYWAQGFIKGSEEILEEGMAQFYYCFNKNIQIAVKIGRYSGVGTCYMFQITQLPPLKPFDVNLKDNPVKNIKELLSYSRQNISDVTNKLLEKNKKWYIGDGYDTILNLKVKYFTLQNDMIIMQFLDMAYFPDGKIFDINYRNCRCKEFYKKCIVELNSANFHLKIITS